ncbi:hypothetical protein SAMN05216188_108206 [Lentzea xinjiangensis]|uniref:Transposase DDE domain-containing protein n=1 Tax=Lentzea xinjiangensis TaxID=402600 RepID=A0A1H9M201_9PSEU|nr:hypothetical protein SAMN05216188_108206 [Lentzea xinjiangensis]
MSLLRGLHGQIAHKGENAPIQASQRWHIERTNAWHNGFDRLQRCYERREHVIDAFFDLADAIITIGSLIREAWTLPGGTADQHAAPEDHLPMVEPVRPVEEDAKELPYPIRDCGHRLTAMGPTVPT